jgi:hydrogenase maturation protease
MPKILVYGYGNPGRQDDGLGVLLADEVESWANKMKFEKLHTDANYQLNLEDAAGIAGYDLVFFADASQEDIQDYKLVPLEPSNRVEFSMHAVSPAFILNLCNQVFNHKPEAYLLHIKGYKWGFMERPTRKAKNNLRLALEHLKVIIADRMKNDIYRD